MVYRILFAFWHIFAILSAIGGASFIEVTLIIIYGTLIMILLDLKKLREKV